MSSHPVQRPTARNEGSGKAVPDRGSETGVAHGLGDRVASGRLVASRRGSYTRGRLTRSERAAAPTGHRHQTVGCTARWTGQSEMRVSLRTPPWRAQPRNPTMSSGMTTTSVCSLLLADDLAGVMVEQFDQPRTDLGGVPGLVAVGLVVRPKSRPRIAGSGGALDTQPSIQGVIAPVPKDSKMDLAIARPRSGGTAFPICFTTWARLPAKMKSSSKD